MGGWFSSLFYVASSQSSNYVRHLGYQELVKATARRKVTRIVLSGGGVRGGVYVGAFKALEEAGVYQPSQSITGSSIGGMTAALMATGMSPRRLQTISMNQKFEHLLGDKTSWYGIERDGMPMLNFLENNIRNNVKAFFQEKSIDQLATAESAEFLRLKQIADNMEAGGNLTFNDLAILRQYDTIRFKDLTLTAVERVTGKVQYFNALLTPNVSIADAARASGSLPVILKPMVINGIEYIDGGYFENIPTEAETSILSNISSSDEDNTLCDDEIQQQYRKERLVFAFSETDDDPVHRALHSEAKNLYTPGWLVRFTLNSIASWLANIRTTKYCTVEAEKGYKNIQQYYQLQTVQMKTGIEARDFDEFFKRKEHLYYEGYFSTKDYLINHDLADESLVYEFRKFAFHFFKNYERKATWLSYFGVDPYESTKAKILFGFCADLGDLTPQQLNQLTYNFIYFSLLDRRTNILKVDTRSASTLLDMLNSIYTNNEIKSLFRLALNISEDTSSLHFEFKESHLEDFLMSQQPLNDPKSIFYSHFTNEEDMVKYEALYRRFD
ncbi:patatin-like phospholipase family protein [Thiotrichales bacterium 19S3-7]|nr:patatin-like phospholipase family protein [Thiotrichales bacterium 19S3-7]MCF6801907.1 patatin-like phospholipase family protein [Thiotrichales bacterium 19S3-11]